MSRILFISPYYPPENGAAPACVGETCIRLVKQGHQVTVLTTLPITQPVLFRPNIPRVAQRGHSS